MSQSATEQQLLENELRGAIDDIRRGNILAFAHFACILHRIQIAPERIANALASRGVSNDEFEGWEADYRLLPEMERADAEYVLNTFAGKPGEFLTFRLGNYEYGIDVLRVSEIRSYEAPTRRDGTYSSVKGVLNLRGVDVPIIDLRRKIGIADPAYDAFTVTIMVTTRDRRYSAGLIVDSVSDVIEIAKTGTRNASPLERAGGIVRATALVDGRHIRLVDVEGELIVAGMSVAACA